MPGMNSGLNVNDPTVVAAFRSALLHQGLIVLLIFIVVGLAWLGLREFFPTASRSAAAMPEAVPAEPQWRQVLRVGFGILWIFDGILQAQPKMAVGLPSQVIEPIAATSPHWVQQVVNWAGTAWSYHPLQAGAAAVWIQLGIGIWLLVAVRGPLSRLAGLVGLGWGLVVWVFGESFGGIFAPGLTWLFGAPGAALVYAIAGGLIALPESAWRSRWPSRLLLPGVGAFLVGMAVLQAWPGRGFWHGTANGKPGALAAMTASMAPTPQPHLLSSWITAFTGFDEANGFAVNLFVVVVLAVIGVTFLSNRPRLIRPVLIAFVIVSLADWVLIEDFGFFGGLGTDPNTMIPFILLASAGYLALIAAPEPAAAPEPTAAPEPAPAPDGIAADPVPARLAGWQSRLRAMLAPGSLGSARLGSVAAIGAIGTIILGAVPMATAQASPVADTILAEAVDGSSAPLNFAASPFQLTDQNGHQVSLASLRGKVVLLTFLDPVCTSDCPLIAQEFKQAGQLLKATAQRVELVAIVANPVDYQLAYTRAFDRQEGLTGVRNWLYLTGSLAQLTQVWHNYGIAADIEPAGAMIGHTEITFAIDQHGRVRYEMGFDPGPGTAATESSFAAELSDTARQLLGSS